jgi:hypothetical protein
MWELNWNILVISLFWEKISITKLMNMQDYIITHFSHFWFLFLSPISTNMNVCTQNVCMYTKCMYVHKMYVCTQNVCMYTKCLYVHKYVCTQNYPILNRRATDCSCQTFSQCLEQVCCKGLANILRERTLWKNWLISTLDKAIYYKGTFLEGSTKPLFTTQNRLQTSWKKFARFFQRASSM